jgi:hypothetical protein
LIDQVNDEDRMNRAVSWLLVPTLLIGASLPHSRCCVSCEEPAAQAALPHVHLSKWGLPWQWLAHDDADGRESLGGPAGGLYSQAEHEFDALYLPETVSTGRRPELPPRICAWRSGSIDAFACPAAVCAREFGLNAQIRQPHGGCPLYVRTLALLI